MIDTSELLSDPDFCEFFNVIRTGGITFGPGTAIPNVQPITLYGAVQVADAETIDMIPEGDRSLGARVFWSISQMFETNEEGLSDIIVYHSKHWRVVRVFDRSANGWWKAYAVRKEGS